jgi:hypothetical protein
MNTPNPNECWFDHEGYREAVAFMAWLSAIMKAKPQD